MEPSSSPISIAEIDAQYEPFPSFETWRNLSVDAERWKLKVNSLNELGRSDEKLLRRARDVAKRAAAIDSGAIEGLYEVDEGFTVTVATQAAMWQAAYASKTEDARRLIEAQMAGYDQVIDLATLGAPMAEVWIRELHRVLCAAQRTYLVLTDAGPQEHELPLGQYKKYPNHVIQSDKTIFAYAPVLQTDSEMRRFFGEISSDSFVDSHPVIQAAYSHYAMVRVHPFADGNGRTCRALASVFTYRAGSIPFLVLMEHKKQYLEALRKADKGDFQAFVDFTFQRCIDAFGLVEESVRTARLPSVQEAVAFAKKLHVTRGGYTHRQVDEAGLALIMLLSEKANDYARMHSSSHQLTIGIGHYEGHFPKVPSAKHRPPRAVPSQHVRVKFDSPAPASAQITINFYFYVPLDAAPTDEILLVCSELQMHTGIPVELVIPTVSTVTRMRLAMYLEGVFSTATLALISKSQESLSKGGYV